jgi:hypothetical protein
METEGYTFVWSCERFWIAGGKREMAAQSIGPQHDAVANLKAAEFEIAPSASASSWMQATRGGVAVLFRKTGDNHVEMFRSPGLLRQGKIFRVLDKGYQKFLTDDQREIPATAEYLQQINSFYQDFKEAIGVPVLFNESLGALTALTHLDVVERPTLAKGERKPKIQTPKSPPPKSQTDSEC